MRQLLIYSVYVPLLFSIYTINAQPRVTQVTVVKEGFIFSNPPFASCHASTITELPNERFMAAWFGGEYEGHSSVGIWTSIYYKGKWSPPKLLATGKDKDTSFPCWNPVLFVNQDQKIFLYYKVGPSPREWWTMVQYSIDNGNTWTKPVRLPGKLDGPVRTKPVQLSNGYILYPSSTESLDNTEWYIHLERTDSTGRNWEKILINCDTFDVIQPCILVHADGTLQMLCRSKQNAIIQTWSSDNGNTWSPLTRTDLPNPNAGIDAVSTSAGFHLLVYNPLEKGEEWWEGRTELRLAMSYDGKTWNDIYTLEKHDEGEYSYPAIIEAENGDIHITYTYNRKNIRHVILRITSTDAINFNSGGE
ncbi:MAG TPA: sialidase family protein [Parasegetibacter sp.]|jgi:predicted neuraminidase